MKAVGFKEFGDPEVLEVMKLPDVALVKEKLKLKIMHPQ
jgi:hypothetical protein